jgi:excinuclease ABC subunit A
MDGLAPAIAIKQKNQTRNPRSTVATATEIFDYLRLLYARCGTVTCLHCGGVVRRDTVDEIVTRVLAMAEGTRVYALFPVVRREVKLEAMVGSATEAVEAAVAAPVKRIAAKKTAKTVSAAPVVDPTDTTGFGRSRLRPALGRLWSSRRRSRCSSSTFRSQSTCWWIGWRSLRRFAHDS